MKQPPAKQTVLVVEDDPVVATAMRMLFERRGWRVLLADTLAGGRRLLDPAPEWLVVDLMLPDGDGLELLRAIHDRGLATQAVVTTGVSDPNHLKAVEEFKPAAILNKPTGFSRILDAMGAGE